MSLANPKSVITEERLSDFYQGILPYLGGGTVDDEISSTSENPVQNKVIYSALEDKADTSDLAAVATSGDYGDLTNTPTLGTAAAKDVPTTGNASTTQVVMGDDSRLTDSRNAADVYSWAKASSKPSYTASEVGAIATTAKGAANGVAELDSSGKVPSSQLPSYVDDVLEYSSTSVFPSTGETGKIYVATDTNKTYRWSGTAYVEISASLALGETSSTAYYGDKGKTAYDHSQTTSGNPHNVTKSDVGLGSVGNFKAVSTVASQGLTDTEKSNARANIGAGTGSGTITGITMNGASKGTSGVVDLGTVITSHQDISGKADKSATVSTVAWDSTNSKITKTINGSTTDVVTGATILGGLTKSQVTTALGYTPPTSDTNTHRPIQVNGTQILGDNTTALNLKAGSNVSVTNSSGTVTIAATDTTYESKSASSGGTAVSLVTTGEKYTWNSKTSNTGTVTSVAAGTGLSGGTITTSGTISLASGVVTAGSAGPTAAVTGNDGATIAVPRITVDTYGRVTGLTSYNLTNKDTRDFKLGTTRSGASNNTLYFVYTT